MLTTRPLLAARGLFLPQGTARSPRLMIRKKEQLHHVDLDLNLQMPFAQLVIGPPGAGKSTYCNGMHQFMGAIGRKCSIVNLDPANDRTSYPCAIDVRDLVTLEEIMDQEKLGPNGATLYALEELEENFHWLEEGLKELQGSLMSCYAGAGGLTFSR